MRRQNYSIALIAALGAGSILSVFLAVQCVRTYLYAGDVLIPQQAEREAQRQAGLVSAAARHAGITQIQELEPHFEQILESAGSSVLWVRVFDMDGRVYAESGHALSKARISRAWFERMERHEELGYVMSTPEGSTYVATLPFRLARMRPPAAEDRAGLPPTRGARRGGMHLIEIAIPLSSVAGSFDGLQRNLVAGMAASLALLVAVVIFALRAPGYLRGRHLESELRLARQVQHDLQPGSEVITPHIQFAASSVAADQVGGDFHDIFETPLGSIGIVLGDVSGKGVPAALLASVIQGSIRSATASHHEAACAQINRMLCERTACERFATLFWGVYDPATGLLRYVNAGHAAPMLRRQDGRVERLSTGGPVLGVLPAAPYAAGTVRVGPNDTLIAYSDGVNEAPNARMEEFGDARIEEAIKGNCDCTPSELCSVLTERVVAFSGEGALADDRTLLVVRFVPASARCADGRMLPLEVAA